MDQRTNYRVDDWLLVEVWPEADGPGPDWAQDTPPPSIEAVYATLDAVRMEGCPDADPASGLSPALAKLEWLLEQVLLALARHNLAAVRLPIARKVNLSGSGIRCETRWICPVGTRVRVDLILPPFQRIRAAGTVVWCQAMSPPRHGALVAIEFVDLPEDDRERLIRHVFRRQADYLRKHRSQQDGT
ncbi:PilZ domain-containing protein [Nitrospira sp. Kam-Ns4a]